MDIHTLVSKLKEVASSLGRVPTKHEYVKVSGVSFYALEKAGGYTAVVQAAGFKPYRSNEKRIDNTIFEKDIVSHLEQIVEAQPKPREPYQSILTISDVHWPFSSKRVVDMYLECLGDVKPEWAILNGDAWDMYSHTKFPRSHNVFTPREEQELARGMNEEFWREVQRRSPSSKCIQMMGNHDLRPMKRVLEAYPEAEDWIAEKLKTLFAFNGVHTIMSATEELIIGDIAVFHGYRSQLGAHRDYTLMNCINGHTHKGGAVFRQIRGSVIWELNSGLAGDPEAKGLTYRPQKITDWTPGFGEVDKKGPRFIPA